MRALLLVSAIALVGRCGGTAHAPSGHAFRIYDPKAPTKLQIRSTDLVLSATSVEGPVPGAIMLHLRFTKEGVEKFHQLTRAVARRGARLHHNQFLTIEIGKTVKRLLIDFREEPNGLPDQSDFEIAGLSSETAQRLAKQIRSGHSQVP